MSDLNSPLVHGGQIRQAAALYGIPVSDWLDLSTGINPRSWPVPATVTSVWSRLPEATDDLVTMAAQYYGTDEVLPVAGTQAAIQALPYLRLPGRVGILAPSYAEHARAWANAGHQVQLLPVTALDAAVNDVAVLVVVNPNNPTGDCFTPAQLLGWYEQLHRRGGWLIVDEAFIDATPAASLALAGIRPGLIILRSLGKFFGLAGARVGFVLAEAAIRAALAVRLGPWPIATPARWVASRALADSDWQLTTRAWLPEVSAQLAALLAQHQLAPHGGCALFQWVMTPAAAAIHAHLARAGILTRLFAEPAAVRFGLPNTAADWRRLTRALDTLADVA